MGISINRLVSSQPPLLRVAEEIMATPEAVGITVRNSGFKLLYLIDGEVELSLDDGRIRYSLAPGDIVVLPKRCTQHYRPLTGKGGRSHFLIFLFAPERKPAVEEKAFRAYLKKTFPVPCRLRTGHSFEIWGLIRRLREAMDSPEAETRRIIREIAKQFVFQAAELAGWCEQPPLPVVWQQLRGEATRLIRSVYHSHRYGAGKGRRLGPLFERYLGMSPARFLNLVRIQRAKELIVDSGLPLSVIARRAGFSSLSTFSRRFREVTGIAPSAYRKEHHGQEPLDDKAFSQPLHCTLLSNGPWQAAEASLLLCLAGSAEFRSGSQRMTLSSSEGLVLLAAKGSRWKITFAGETRLLAVRGGNAMRRSRLVAIPEPYILEMIRWYSSMGTLHARLVVESWLRSLLLMVAKIPARGLWHGGASRNPSSTVNRLPVDYAIEFIRKHYWRQLRLSEIAWFAGVSEEHLARRFRLVFGKSVMAYLKEVRLERVKALLASTGKTVTRIAEETGFGTAALLCRTFRCSEGISPMEYRRRAQAGGASAHF